MLHWIRSGHPGPTVCFSFGVHGDERAPIDAGYALAASLSADALSAGSLLLVLGNPQAVDAGRRYLEVDLNRCFTAAVLGREPRNAEEHRAQVLASALGEVEILLDFHCTVEPGERFVMHHPSDARHRKIAALLDASVSLSDPNLCFGGCSLDELMSASGRVGICYETGWMGDPGNTPERIEEQMRNVLRGLGMLPGAARVATQRPLVLTETLRCPAGGFAWAEGVGHNLQALPAGTLLGQGGTGALRLKEAATLIFPKKRPDVLGAGQPLVYLAAGA